MSRLSMRNDKDPVKKLFSYRFKVANTKRTRKRVQATKSLGEPAIAPKKDFKLTQELLNKATLIYFKHAWGRTPTDGELCDMKLKSVMGQIEEENGGGTFSCRFGCQDIGAGNMKLDITMHNGSFFFQAYVSSDWNLSERIKRHNQETVRKIEEEWRQNGISVFPKADSIKS